MSIILSLKVKPGKTIRRGNDYFWQAIRELTETDSKKLFTVKDVHGMCAKVARQDIQQYIRSLVEAGIAENKGSEGHYELNYYALKRRPIETPVFTSPGNKNYGLVQQNLWNTMCYALKRGFKVRELQALASTEEVPITIHTVKSYVRSLNKAGMFIVQGKGVATTYRLKPSANTGPKAPKILRSKMVFDANTQSIIGDVDAEEVSS